MTSLPAKKPHFLGKTWSSMWMPLTPMDSYSRDAAPDVDGVAVAGVAVGDDGDVDGVGDVAGVGHHLGLGQQANVGETLLRRGAGAGHVHGAEPHGLGDLGVERVQAKGCGHHAIALQHGPQPGRFFRLSWLPPCKSVSSLRSSTSRASGQSFEGPHDERSERNSKLVRAALGRHVLPGCSGPSHRARPIGRRASRRRWGAPFPRSGGQRRSRPGRAGLRRHRRWWQPASGSCAP